MPSLDGLLVTSYYYCHLGRGDVVPRYHSHHDARHLALLHGQLHVLSKGILDALPKNGEKKIVQDLVQYSTVQISIDIDILLQLLLYRV